MRSGSSTPQYQAPLDEYVKRALMPTMRTSATAMAKRSAARSGKDKQPMFYATTTYKQWLRKKVDDRGWSLPMFRDELERYGADVTTQAIGDFFGSREAPAGPSNIAWMPAANKVIGIAPPPVCDPTSPISQLGDRFLALWPQLTKKERNMVLAAFGLPPEP
jgi:hypothetical protein